MDSGGPSHGVVPRTVDGRAVWIARWIHCLHPRQQGIQVLEANAASKAKTF
jgi:hypothetical protein